MPTTIFVITLLRLWHVLFFCNLPRFCTCILKKFKTLKFFITILGILHYCKGRKKKRAFLTTKISLKAFLFKVLSLLVWVWVFVWNFTYMQLLSYWGSEWLGCICFNLLRDFGNFWHICSDFILFSQCRTWFSGIDVVLYVVLVG